MAFGRSKPVTCALVLWATMAGPVSAGAAAELRLGLREALDRSLAHAPQVEAALADSVGATYSLRAARAAWLPRIGLTGNAFTFRPADPIGPGFLGIGAEWQQVFVTNLRLSYPIYAGGRRTNQIRLEHDHVNAAASELSSTRLANAYQCRRAYFGLLMAGRLLRSAELSRERVEIIRRNVENLHENGMADSVDVLDIQISVRQAERRVEENRTRQRNASAALARLIGASPDTTIRPTDSVPEPQLDPGTFRADSTAVAGRPELAVLEHRRLAAEHQRAVVKSKLLPAVSGSGGYLLVRPDVGNLGGDWNSVLWAGLSLSWDLNLGGAEFSQTSRARAAARAVELRRRDLQDALILQAQTAWNNLEEAYRMFVIQQEEFDLAGHRFRLARRRQAAGRMALNRLLELETELAETQQHMETARLDFYAAQSDYLYAIGSEALREGI